jgi:hypothetical protein
MYILEKGIRKDNKNANGSRMVVFLIRRKSSPHITRLLWTCPEGKPKANSSALDWRPTIDSASPCGLGLSKKNLAKELIIPDDKRPIAISDPNLGEKQRYTIESRHKKKILEPRLCATNDRIARTEPKIGSKPCRDSKKELPKSTSWFKRTEYSIFLKE